MKQKFLIAIAFLLIVNIFKTQAQETGKEVFIKVEKEAEFIGGQDAWVKYLSESIDSEIAVKNGAGPGKYMVIIKFIVSKDGKVTSAEAETNFGLGMEREAIRVILQSPGWTAAMVNGKNVNAYKRQPITFVVEKDKKKRRVF